MWQQKLKQGFLLKFPVRLLKKPVNKGISCKSIMWEVLIEFSTRCFIWGHYFKKSNGLLVLRAHQIAEYREFHGGISWKLSFPRGCFIRYHSLSKSDRLFFLKTHQIPRGGSMAATTSKMERFVIIVNGLQLLTIITKRSILDVAAALDPPLGISSESIS